ARQLAERAYSGPYGVKQMAGARLQEIDREEYNQKLLTERRSFDAGLAAFNRGDTFQAREIFAVLNPAYLDGARKAPYRELMAAPGMGRQDNDVRTAQATGSDTQPPVPGSGQGEAGPGRAQASDNDLRSDPLATAQALQAILMQELRAKSIDARNEAGDRF